MLRKLLATVGIAALGMSPALAQPAGPGETPKATPAQGSRTTVYDAGFFTQYAPRTAYDIVQRNAMKTWETKHAGRDDIDFLAVLMSDPEASKYFKKGELEKLCSLDFHFKEVKRRFKRLGL